MADYKQLVALYSLDDQKNSVSTGNNRWGLYASLYLI